jgi:hypothetical protein
MYVILLPTHDNEVVDNIVFCFVLILVTKTFETLEV